MRNYILTNIREGLDNNLGELSSYKSVLVEEVSNQIPESVTVNYFVGIDIINVNSLDREIGKSYPVRRIYECSIVVLVKNADFDNGQNEVDVITNRIFKYFAQDIGSLNGLSLTRDGVKETVIDFNIDNMIYGQAAGLKVGQLGNACLISLNIMTEIII